MIKFNDINIEKLNLVEALPQVGSRKYEYSYDNNSFELDKEMTEPVDFIINDEGEFLLGVGHYKLNNKRKTLYSAGRVLIKNGKIVYIDNDSGHYSPSYSHIQSITTFLIEKGLAVEGISIIDINNQL